jgi:hypothetical protein
MQRRTCDVGRSSVLTVGASMHVHSMLPLTAMPCGHRCANLPSMRRWLVLGSPMICV